MQGVGPGTVLGGRYALHQRIAQSPSIERWTAHDSTLGRSVTALCISGKHPNAPAALDAARRAAGVETSRLVQVLDVGHADGAAPVSFVIEESLENSQSLTELLAEGGLPSERVRRIIGEAATALEGARQRGLHHLHLTPASIWVAADGRVLIQGVATLGALSGADALNSAVASRMDTVALLASTYAGLTGRWPLESRVSGLDPAPKVVGGVAAPSEIAAGVPADLDALCRLTLAQNAGPITPGDLATQIAPWPLMDPRSTVSASASVQETSPGAIRPAPAPTATEPTVAVPSPVVPTPVVPTPVVPMPVVSTPPAPAATAPAPASPATAAPAPTEEPAAPALDETRELEVAAEAAPAVLTTTPGEAPAPAPDQDPAEAPDQDPDETEPTAGTTTDGQHEDLAQDAWDPSDDTVAIPRLAVPSPDDEPSARATSASASDNVTAPPTAPNPPARTAGTAPGKAVGAAGGVATTTGATVSAAKDSAAAGAVAAGAALAGAATATGSALTSAGRATASAAGTAADRVGSWSKTTRERVGQGLEARRERSAAATAETSGGWGDRSGAGTRTTTEELETPLPLLPASTAHPPSRTQTRIVLALMAVFVFGALGFGAYGMSKIGSNTSLLGLGDDPGRPQVTVTAPTQTVSPTQAPEEDTPAAPTKVELVGATGFDPEGDNSENNEDAANVIDGDPATDWQSEGYESANFGGLKDGVGIAIDLGDARTPSDVTLDLPQASSGTLYVADTAQLAGAKAIGTWKDASGNVKIPAKAQANGRFLIVWFTAPSSDGRGRFRTTLAEVTVAAR